MIDDPVQWRLILKICESSLKVMVLSLDEPTRMIYRNLPLDLFLDLTKESKLKALESVVYDNPLLLSDFRRVDCYVDTPRYILTPADDPSSPQLCHQLLKKVFPDEGYTTLTSPSLPYLHFQVDTAIASFLKRTFFNINLSHPLAPMITGSLGFIPPSKEGEGPEDGPGFSSALKTTFVNFQPGVIYVVITRGENLLLANSFTYEETTDIVYYILAMRDTLKLDQESDPLYYSGTSTDIEEVLTFLRHYIRAVRPLPLLLPLPEASDLSEQPPYEFLLS